MAASRVPQPDDSIARVAASPAGGHAQTARLLAGPPVPRRPGLPTPLSSMVGRQREIAEVVALFGDSAARLVTLTGPGGIGKTRLALAAAERLEADFPHSVWFIPLASIADPALVIPSIAQALGVLEAPDQPILERLSSALRERHALLVIDNLEHVIAVVADIARVLAACPAVCVLATSRESLRLQGEYEYPVPPLAFEPAGVVLESEAVRLFVERARQALPGFRLDAANAPAVVDICRRLDGMPLALELAAARIKVLGPADLLARLDQSLAVLAGGARDAPPRQRTMRDALQWSYDLLTSEEQRLFRRMAVFAGGCTLEAVEAIAEDVDTLTTLSSLVDKSLIRRVRRPKAAARYILLEPIRQFAWELLAAVESEAAHARQLHADFYHSFVAGVRRSFDGPEGPTVLEQVDSERANLRVALDWLRERDLVQPGLEMIHELGIFWLQRSHINEGRNHVEAFLNAPDGGHGTLARAAALWPAAWLWMVHGDVATTLPMIEEACSIAEEHGDLYILAHALNVRGVCHLQHKHYAEAQADWERALQIFREHEKDDAMVVRVLFNIANVASEQGALDVSRSILEEALALARARDLTMVTATTLTVLAKLEARSGNEDRAVEIFVDCLAYYQRLGIPKGVANALFQIALLTRHKGCHQRAACLYGAAWSMHELSGFALRSIHDYPDVDEELAASRATLPDAIFEAAWEQGRGMSMEEAVAFASQSGTPRLEAQAAAPLVNLTPRELEVLALVTRGMSNREIAAQLYISARTVERHIENFYRKLDIHSRAEAVAFGRRHLTD